MCYSASKLADGLHLLRLRELDLQVLLFGYIDEVEGEAIRRVSRGGGNRS